MPWFKIDDGFHCHPKVFAAGTAAVGLYVRCGSWAAQQVTDGVIPKQIAKMYGTPRMAKALVEAGLWHQAGHDCQSCPEVDANSYSIHQYLEKNPSRVETDLARKAKSERQQRWREGKQKEQVKGHEPFNVDGDVDASTRRHGDAAPNPSRPVPLLSPTEKEEKNEGQTEEPARIGDRPRIPTNCEPLVAALQQAQLYVGWDLKTAEWFLIEALIKRCGIPALVVSAKGSWQGALTQPRKGSYFLPGWRKLASAEEEPEQAALPAAVGAEVVQYGPVPHQAVAKPSTTDQRVNQALEVGRRLQAIADAKKQENQ